MQVKQRKRRDLGRRIVAILLVAVIVGLAFWVRNLLINRNSHTDVSENTSPSANVNSPSPGTDDPDDNTADPNTPPAGYTQIAMTEDDLAEGSLILVNNDTYYEPGRSSMVPIYNIKTSSYQVSAVDIQIQTIMQDALNAMMDDFYAYSGLNNITIASSYRDYALQERLFQEEIELRGSEEEAAKWVTRPGYSEHHTGLALDFTLIFFSDGHTETFTGDGEYAWIREHAREYGFILRYPADKTDITGISYESWHYRYVGVPHAEIMEEQGLCLEEYLDYLQSFTVSGQHLTYTASDGQTYEIYYCPKDQVYVPETQDYTISGDNYSGYIITICNG